LRCELFQRVQHDDRIIQLKNKNLGKRFPKIQIFKHYSYLFLNIFVVAGFILLLFTGIGDLYSVTFY
jgi:hypothetical protein